ncbi:MAG: IclR family transcriptional regulator [Terriglobia bacterium]
MPANNYISVLEKGFRVLEAFQGEREVALRELAARTRLVKSSVFRILFTLERLGYVEKQTGGRYSVAPRLGRLSSGQKPPYDLSGLATPFLAKLRGRFQETVNLGVLDGGEVLYVQVLESPHPLRMAVHPGMRGPLHSTALGKCLLCRMSREQVDEIMRKNPLRAQTSRTIRSAAALQRELEKVRSQGCALDNEEDSPGVRCIAAPVLGSDGRVQAAISISGPATRVKPSRDAEFAKALTETAAQLTTLTAYSSRRIAG